MSATPPFICRTPSAEPMTDEVTRLKATLGRTGSAVEVWFDVPHGAEPLQAQSDAFALAALLPAMRIRADLIVEGPVSPDLLSNLHHLRTIYSDWFPEFAPIEIEASAEPHTVGSGARGLFFSGGADSFHTAITAPDLFDDLIHVAAFDTLHEDESLRSAIRRSVESAARELGRPLTHVATNVRSLMAPHADWPRNHTIALAAVGHALAGRFGGCLVAADRSYLGREPFASHPIMIRSLGSERLTMEAHGWATSRIDKMSVIVDSEPAMKHLRVCWENRNAAFNCGVCDKCVRTRVDLALAGGADRCATFKGPLDLDLVAAIEIARPSLREYATTALVRARSSPEHQHIAAALEEALRQADARDAAARVGPDFALLADVDGATDFVSEHRDGLYAHLSARHGRWLVAQVLRSIPGRIWQKVRRINGRRPGPPPDPR